MKVLTSNQKVLFYFRVVPVIRVTSARIRQDARKDGLYYYGGSARKPLSLDKGMNCYVEEIIELENTK